MRTRLVMLVLLAAMLAPSAVGRPAERGTRNGRIVFVVPGGNGIASMNPDGSGTWELMLGGSDGEPAFSRDGTRLAVAVRWPGIEGITVMDPDGWSRRSRLTASAGDASPSWSPDGGTIAFATADGDIELVASSGGPTRRLTTGVGQDRTPAWSPDGRTIAFVRQDVDPVSGWTESSLWTVDVATGSETLVVRYGRDDNGAPFLPGEPSWSPSGVLAYVVGSTVRVRAANGGEATLLRGVDQGTRVAWAPAGDRLLFVREGSLWLADAGGTEIGRLGPGVSPAWQALPTDPGGGCTLWGTAGADILVGTSGPDVVCGLAGDDTVLGLDGSDTLRGGSGADWIAGGQGTDVLIGNDGADRLDLRDGAWDQAYGGTGVDSALLDRGVDTSSGVERRRIDGNLAAWRPVRVSGASIADSAVRAVDGRPETAWNAGGWPPQWIEVDLLQPTDIGRIRLVAGPQAGGVVQLILGKGPSTRGAYRLLRTLRGPTAARQEVVLVPKRPWRGIDTLRIETPRSTTVGGWVSWHELEVYAARPR